MDHLTLHTTQALNITAVTTNTITINVGTASDDQTITGKFPAVHTQGTYEFLVQAVPDSNSITLNVGVSTTDYLYVSGGTAFVGLTTTKYPDKVSKSYYEVLEVPDIDNFKCNVGISSINHTYVEGGQVTDLTPAILETYLRLSSTNSYQLRFLLSLLLLVTHLEVHRFYLKMEHLMILQLLTTGVTCSRCLMLQQFRRSP